MIQVGEHYFEIIVNYKDGFNLEQFENRYSEVLDRYPYIVGDIGFEQLRLRGFVEDHKKNSEVNKRYSTIMDYIYESCNFGCAYFVLRRLSAQEVTKLHQPETIIDVDNNVMEETVINKLANTLNEDENTTIESGNQNEQTHIKVDDITSTPIRVEMTEQTFSKAHNEENDVDLEDATHNKTFKHFLK